MNFFVAFLKLIRWPNLLIIALTQYLVRYGLIDPFLSVVRLDFQLDPFHFFLLVLSTLLITAGGYIINDYFDVRTDTINKPERIIVDTQITRRTAISIHMVLNIIGICLGVFLGWKAGNFNLGIIHIVAAGLLWFYSTSYKKQFLVGNVVIAFLTALVVLIVGFYERQIYTILITEYQAYAISKALMQLVLGYAFFAFMISLIREMIKDVQDREGDADIRSKTMPLVIGLRKSKWVIEGVTVVFLLILGYLAYQLGYKESWGLFCYLLLAIMLPLTGLLIYLARADHKTQFIWMSQALKGIMLMGVLSMFVFRMVFTIAEAGGG